MERYCGQLEFSFRLGLSATEATKKIHAAYGEDSISYDTVCRYYRLRKSGEEYSGPKPKSGRPSLDIGQILRELVDEDPFLTTRELAKAFDCGNATIWRHLRKLGLTNKWNIWVPHVLSPKHEETRYQISQHLLYRQIAKPFLDKLVTGDEKWVLFCNKGKKRGWSEPGVPLARPKPDRFGKKLLLCVWWDISGIIYHELLPDGETVTADVYCRQMTAVADAMRRRSGVTWRKFRPILLHDNARPHTAKKTKEKLEELRFEVLPHPPYSPDLAPSDFHLFRSMQHSLSERNFRDEEEVKSFLIDFFDSKPQSFYERGIYNLKDRWQTVISTKGQYCI